MKDRNDPKRLKTRLDETAEGFGLSKENHDLTIKQCFESSMSPDEPTIVIAVMANYVGQVQKPLLKALNDAPAQIEDAAARAVGPVAEAATAKVEAAHAALTADVGKRVSDLTERRLAIYERERARKWNLTLVAGGAGLLATGCLAGYGIGAANVSGLAADIAVFAKRADAAAWLQLMSTTPDLTGNIEKFCAPESPETFKVLTGRQACGIWFWMDGNTAPQLKSIARGLTKTASDGASILPWYAVGILWMSAPFAIRWALKKMNAGTWLEGLSKALKH